MAQAIPPAPFYKPMQLELFESTPIAIEEVFEAYRSCRMNKRRTANAVAFEVDYETNLIQLWEEINSRTYRPGRSVAFIVDRPVKREIFAASFRDRVVHHLIINKINALLERDLIYDCYACRVGKGSHLGIRRLDHFIRSCSKNHSIETWVLKLDISGFFMAIDRGLLFSRLSTYLNRCYIGSDLDLVLWLCRTVIMNDPTKGCILKCPRESWEELPAAKSLFHSPQGCGLPIGNLTSQVFANFYLSPLDHFVKQQLGIRCYGRYVDDFVLVHNDRDYLRRCIPVIRHFLLERLALTLHPKKILLQNAKNGVRFLGVVVEPGHINVTDRIKQNSSRMVASFNAIVEQGKPVRAELLSFQSSINSYLGIMRHHDTYHLRGRLATRISPWWWRYFRMDGDRTKIIRSKRVGRLDRDLDFNYRTCRRSFASDHPVHLYPLMQIKSK